MHFIRIAAVLLTAILFLFQPPVTVSGQSQPALSFSVDRQNAERGDHVCVQIKANETEPTAAAFRVRVSYDDSVFSFTGSETSSQIESGTLKVNSASNPIFAVYVCNVDQGYAAPLSGTVLTLRFRVKQDAAAENTKFEVQSDQICDFDGNSLDCGCSDILSVNVQQGSSREAFLTALVPSAGTLTPDFSQETDRYVLNVESGVNSVQFQASAADDGTVKVSRKSLQAAGTDTPIVITVTSADKKLKKQYQVTVRRAPKPEELQETQRKSCLSKKSKSRSGAGTINRTNKLTSGNGGTVSESQNAVPQNAAASGTIPADTNAVTRQTGNGQESSVLYFEQDRFPSYLVGMLAAALCMITGIALHLWLSARQK